MQTKNLLEEIKDYYGEWIEMFPHHEEKILIDILSSLLLKEKEKTAYLERIIRG